MPFGIILIFLTDYLAQEQHISVISATLLVRVNGVGCEVSGILGAYCGRQCEIRGKNYLPVFIGTTNNVGIFPYLKMLDVTLWGHRTNRTNVISISLAFSSGMIEHQPSDNIQPSIVNVNPPQLREAALTTANLIVNLLSTRTDNRCRETQQKMTADQSNSTTIANNYFILDYHAEK